MLNKDSIPTPETKLGSALRERRKELRLTMQQVAKEAGLSIGFISQVERGLTAPSLSSLAALSDVLRTPISAFLEQPDGHALSTHRADRNAYSVPGAEITYERLSATFEGSTLHALLIHEPPGHRSEPISHPGEEMFFLLAGELTVEIEGEREILRKGDSLHFDSNRTHSTWNHGTEIATLLWCGTMDVFGSVPPPIHREVSEEGGAHTNDLHQTNEKGE